MKIGRYFLIGIAAVVVIFLWVRSTRIDYLKKSRELEQVINQKLLELNLSEKDLLKAYNEEKSQGRIKWVYFTRELRVSRDFSFDKCAAVLKEGVKRRGGKVISSSIDGQRLTLKIGIRKIITHLLIFERTSALARVAIIIDDFGFNKDAMEEFMKLDYPLTFSVLPKLKYSKIAAELAHKSGKEVMLHLPLQGSKKRIQCKCNYNVDEKRRSREES